MAAWTKRGPGNRRQFGAIRDPSSGSRVSSSGNTRYRWITDGPFFGPSA